MKRNKTLKALFSLTLATFFTITVFGKVSMLCMGHYWTQEEAEMVMEKFAAEWEDLDSWEKRAFQIKKGIIEGMQFDKMPEINGNFNTIIVGTKKMDGYIVENIAIESFPGFYVTGNLYRPTTEKDKYPIILSPHGHLKDKRFTHYIQKRAAVLARMGAIVFAYDMIGYGESQQVDHKIPIALLLQTWNSKRILDYLLSRPDVDENRVGITGGSGGATQSFILTAIDDRISVSVPVVQISAHFFGGCVCESGMPIHKSTNHQTNNVEIASLCAPRPILLVSDGDDWTKNTPKIEYPYIRNVYSLYKATDKIENVHLYAEVHDYGYSKRIVAYNFLAYHLELDYKNIPYDDGFNEGFVTILSREDLQVFNSDNPRPKNLLQGDEAVLNYFESEFNIKIH